MSWDYIVVGAGGAGAPLATRLSENPEVRVLLLEAGPDYGSPEAFPADIMNAGLMTGALPHHPNNWAFLGNLTPEVPYLVARGKILGGSTAVNGAYFVRARKDDFDSWAAAGNSEWSWQKMLPVMKRLERDLDFGESPVHGGSGPMPVKRELRNPHPLTKAFYEACRELGFPEDPDKNDEPGLGYGPLPVNAVDGVRVNTGNAYINQHRDRTNLVVRGETPARRILFDGTRAVGVEVESGGSSEIIGLEQEGGEVIVCAGAIKSPHLLALSGIGAREELEDLGIEVVSDRPGVGREFSDHPDLMITWKARNRRQVEGSGNLFEAVLNSTAAESPYVGDLEVLPCLRSMRGMMDLGKGGALGAAWELGRRPLATLRSLRGVSVRRLLAQVTQLDSFFFTIAVQRPESRGTIKIESADPLVQPRIDYNYLSNASDLRRMREVVRLSTRILQTQAFKPYLKRISELDSGTLEDDDRLDGWMRTHLATSIHASGSAKMGPVTDQASVVDQFGRVHGVSGLRVADTSILPFVPSRGPAATAILIGERVSDFIASGAGAVRETA